MSICLPARSLNAPDRGHFVIVDAGPDDVRFMAEALRVAGRIPRRPWPNPPVGAVVVQQGRIVGSGAHQGPGYPHAEALALEEARGLARGATLYCTLEPCNHTGRTPPCAPLLIEAGIRRAVVAIADPNPRVCGGGLERLCAAGVDLTLGVMASEALDLIWPFAATDAFARPFVLLKTATSIDGRFGPPPSAGSRDGPVYLTGLDARRDVHELRRWADLVLVGEQTLALDHPRLDGRLVAPDAACPSAEPVAGYVDTDLSDASEWRGQRYHVFCGRNRARPEAATRIAAQGGTVVPCAERDGHVDPAALLEEVFGTLAWSVVLEGGPALASTFLARGLVDRWVSYTAPVFLGGGPTWPGGAGATATMPSQAFSLTRVERAGTDVKAVFDRMPFDGRLKELTVGRLDALRQPKRSW